MTVVKRREMKMICLIFLVIIAALIVTAAFICCFINIFAIISIFSLTKTNCQQVKSHGF